MQVEIDKIWSQLANDMEEEVLARYKSQKKTNATAKGEVNPQGGFIRKRDRKRARLKAFRWENI